MGSVHSWIFPERDSSIIPHLEGLLEVERDPQVAATVAISGGLLNSSGSARLISLLEQRLHGRHQVERWGAAIGLEWWSHSADPLVGKLLEECMCKGDRSVSEVPFYDGNIDVMAGLAKTDRRRRAWGHRSSN